ncbi:MAG: YheU family protein [Francisellaceae bacterium]|jgi:uncharacterized protein|nr:YheU family protein [Francisellaceae bacterium]MBT6207670.1 YheU family protein [Francisellaceae bacterium]MBT6538360.1 YheU family protein [Francisellaceae bacterium]
MKISLESLEEETLQNLLEEIVTRDGTSYSSSELTVQQEVNKVKAMLLSGEAYVFFDEETESCNIISHDEYLKTL